MILGHKRGRPPKPQKIEVETKMDNVVKAPEIKVEKTEAIVKADEGTKQELFPVILLRNYADLTTGEKHFAGSGISLPLEEAKNIMDLGIAKRNDPLR